MFPLRDHNPTKGLPITTVLLIGAAAVVWWRLQGGGFSEEALSGSICRFGVIPAEITGQVGSGVDGPCALGGETWEAGLTSIFLHGSWMHLIGNMWFLWIFGNNVEDEVGHGRFLVFYLLTGCVAAAAQIAASPGSAVPMVGASGAVSAVMGAYLVLFPKARVDTLFFFFVFLRVVPLPAWIMLGYWMLLQLFASTVTPSGAGGVAYMAHVGGFAAGVLLVWPFRAGRPARRRAGAARGRS